MKYNSIISTIQSGFDVCKNITEQVQQWKTDLHKH